MTIQQFSTVVRLGFQCDFILHAVLVCFIMLKEVSCSNGIVSQMLQDKFLLNRTGLGIVAE